MKKLVKFDITLNIVNSNIIVDSKVKEEAIMIEHHSHYYEFYLRHFTEEEIQKLLNSLIEDKQNLLAVKIYKVYHNCGLREAKEKIDVLIAAH